MLLKRNWEQNTMSNTQVMQGPETRARRERREQEKGRIGDCMVHIRDILLRN